MRCVATQNMGPAFEGERAAESQEIFQVPRKLVGTVGVQPVIAHADPQPHRHPVENHRGDQGTPTEHKKCGNRAHMQHRQNTDDGPVQLAVFIDTLNFACQRVSLSYA